MKEEELKATYDNKIGSYIVKIGKEKIEFNINARQIKFQAKKCDHATIKKHKPLNECEGQVIKYKSKYPTINKTKDGKTEYEYEEIIQCLECNKRYENIEKYNKLDEFEKKRYLIYIYDKKPYGIFNIISFLSFIVRLKETKVKKRTDYYRRDYYEVFVEEEDLKDIIYSKTIMQDFYKRHKTKKFKLKEEIKIKYEYEEMKEHLENNWKKKQKMKNMKKLLK